MNGSSFGQSVHESAKNPGVSIGVFAECSAQSLRRTLDDDGGAIVERVRERRGGVNPFEAVFGERAAPGKKENDAHPGCTAEQTS